VEILTPSNYIQLMEQIMPHKTTFDIVTVWVATGIANIIGIINLPILKDVIAIVSLLLAMAYTLYRFTKEWRGWNPRKRK